MEHTEIPQDILALCKCVGDKAEHRRFDSAVCMAESLICKSPAIWKRIRNADNKELEFVRCVDSLVGKWNPYGCIEAMDRYLAAFENPTFNPKTLQPLKQR